MYVCYARSWCPGQPQPPAFRPPFPVARPPMPYGPRPLSRYPPQPGPAPPMWYPPPGPAPPPWEPAPWGPPPPSQPVIERQFAGVVGDHHGSSSRGRDSSTVEVIYPVKKIKAVRVGKVSSKKR